MKLTIALGTQSKPKKEYLDEVLKDLGIDADVSCIDVPSGVTDQPLSEGDTKDGSINRARNALKELPHADFGLGIEVGYHKAGEQGLEMMCSAAIINQGGKLVQAYSSRLLLPSYHQEKLANGDYLGDHVNDYKKDSNDAFVHFTRDMIANRAPFIKESVRNALLSYLSYI